MAIAGSGLLIPTHRDVYDVTQLALDLDAETHKAALFTNAIAPNFSTDTAYGVAPYDANEVAGAGYVAGGVVVTGTTWLESPAGVLTWDVNDPQWAASTITNARGVLYYADALVGNNGICLIDLGADYSTQNGLFVVQVNALGVFTWDVVA